MDIRRSFVRLGQRFVHYRHAGSGPVLVMLHQSPQNSRMWLEPMRWLCRDYQVLAPDLPGFGHSDPLDLVQPTIADLSAACHAWLDALGVRQCAVFGMHTGGIVAVHMGLDRPERVGLVMVDGYAIFNDQERALLGERYLPPFQPDWSGQHLRWLWARMREQSFFFPWCEQGAEFALRYPAPDSARTHAAVMDVLEVGDQYRLGYRAALRFANRGSVASLRMPTRLFYREDDVLIGHHERLPRLPAHVQAPRLPERTALWAALTETLAAWAGPVQSHRSRALETGWQRRVVATELGQIATWVWAGQAEPRQLRLVLHGPGQMPPRPGPERPHTGGWLIQPDLPGHGASAECFPGRLDDMADALVELCLSLAWKADLAIEASQGSTALALAVADRWPDRVNGLSLIQPWLPDAEERDWLLDHLPDLSPKPAGGHLLEAWQWERERHLFPPWKAPLAEHRLAGAAPEVKRVHANTVALVSLGTQLPQLMAEMLPPNLSEQLLSSPYPIQMDFDPARDDGRLAALARHFHAAQSEGNHCP